uniref:Sushi domain-containing protein n=1 Tax=Varanus komodoensis TaxID=61221 RepID=A0A8D2IQL0_VARKO
MFVREFLADTCIKISTVSDSRRRRKFYKILVDSVLVAYRGRRCGHAPVIQNGDFLEIPLNNYESGSVLTFKCQQSYIMRGSPVVRCINGNWTETPVCVEPCTIAEEDMKHNKIHLKWRDENKLYARSGEFVEFVCMFGYQPDPSSLPFRQQCIEGQLKYPKCVLVCIM